MLTKLHGKVEPPLRRQYNLFAKPSGKSSCATKDVFITHASLPWRQTNDSVDNKPWKTFLPSIIFSKLLFLGHIRLYFINLGFYLFLLKFLTFVDILGKVHCTLCSIYRYRLNSQQCLCFHFQCKEFCLFWKKSVDEFNGDSFAECGVIVVAIFVARSWKEVAKISGE